MYAFHSACVRILRRDADKLGYADNFTIYDTADSQSLVKRILKEMELLLGKRGRWKLEGQVIGVQLLSMLFFLLL